MLVISCGLKYSFTEGAEKKACHFKEMEKNQGDFAI